MGMGQLTNFYFVTRPAGAHFCWIRVRVETEFLGSVCSYNVQDQMGKKCGDATEDQEMETKSLVKLFLVALKS